jgi:hypothetical protein
MDLATIKASDYVPGTTPTDPIATLRTLIRVVCLCFFLPGILVNCFLQIQASSLWRQYFSQVLKCLEQPDLQLLCDMDVQWSSTLLMVEHALQLQTVRLTSFDVISYS